MGSKSHKRKKKPKSKRSISINFTFKNVLSILITFFVILLIYFSVKQLQKSLYISPKKASTTITTTNQYDIPVMLLFYLPDEDNDRNDDIYGKNITLLSLKVRQEAKDAAEFLTDASRYKGYENESAVPSLNYRIVDDLVFEENVKPPIEKFRRHDRYFPDYNKILQEKDICTLVDSGTVKEVWMWTYHNEELELTESNLSSKFGDVSNSYRDNNDLPVCNRSYTLYNFNYERALKENIHNHVHQIEHLLNEWPKRDNTSKSKREDLLFWGKWVGSGADQRVINNPGCGWGHYPPNIAEDVRRDYLYTDENVRLSDCENWLPDGGGQKEEVSCSTWTEYYYGTTSCAYKSRTELSFYKWWMQNLPGYGNDLTYQGQKLRNWWDYLGDLDGVHASNEFLTYKAKAESVTPTPVEVVRSRLSTPSNNSDINIDVVFKWTNSQAPAEHHIYLGDTSGGREILSKRLSGNDKSYPRNTSEASSLEEKLRSRTGSKIYLRLWTNIKTTDNTMWRYVDYSFTLKDKTTPTSLPNVEFETAKITSLSNNGSFNFPLYLKWNTPEGASEYHLYVGTTRYGRDLFNRSLGSATSITLHQSDFKKTIENYQKVYILLWTKGPSDKWYNNSSEYTYKETDVAELISHQNKSLIEFPEVFRWLNAKDSLKYHIFIGSSPDSFDLYNKSQGQNLSVTLIPQDLRKNVIDGQKIYLKLWTQTENNVWKSTKYEFTVNK